MAGSQNPSAHVPGCRESSAMFGDRDTLQDSSIICCYTFVKLDPATPDYNAGTGNTSPAFDHGCYSTDDSLDQQPSVLPMMCKLRFAPPDVNKDGQLVPVEHCNALFITKQKYTYLKNSSV